MLRPRANYPGQHRLFSIAQAVAEGCFGAVSKMEERSTDETKGCPILSKKKVHKRLVKCISATQKNNWTPEEVKENANNEYVRNKKAPHLNVKELIEQDGKYYIIMDEVPGVTLLSIIKDIQKNKLILSVEEYLRLCIAIAVALQQQVHKLDLIHLDIKPDNIMVDLSNPRYPVVNIIDYGFAKHVNEVDGKPSGTPAYLAPEIAYGQGSGKKSDVHSLGVSLAYLIGFEDKKNGFPIVTFDTRNGGLVQTQTCFSILPKLKNVRYELQLLITDMCNPDVSKRAGLITVIEKLHRIRLKQKTDGLDISIKNSIVNAYNAAAFILDKLKQDKSFAEIRQLIQDAKFDNSLVAIEEFLETLRMSSLSGCRSKEEVLDRIDAIEKSYLEKSKKLNDIATGLATFKQRHKKNTFFKNDQLGGAIAEYQHIVSRKIEKHTVDKHASLDDFVAATNSMDRAIKNMPSMLEIMIEKRCHRVFDRTFSWQTRDDLIQVLIKLQSENKHEDKNMRILINSIKQGVSNYLNNNGSGLNLFFGLRAGSRRRLQNMNEILAIANDRNILTTEDLKKRVTEKLECMELGPAAHSDLKNEVEAALKINLSP